jgi:hypothetical protein
VAIIIVVRNKADGFVQNKSEPRGLLLFGSCGELNFLMWVCPGSELAYDFTIEQNKALFYVVIGLPTRAETLIGQKF